MNDVSPEQAARAASDAPFGIRKNHFYPGNRLVARIAFFVIVGGVLLAAMLGVLGGGSAERTTARGEAAVLSVDAQRVLRSGNWFETRIEVAALQDIADLTVAIERPLWRRLSIDTLEPQPQDAEYADGAFRYSFGPLEAGDRLDLKIDGQIQPWGFRRLRGQVILLDGERPLAAVPLTVTVLP